MIRSPARLWSTMSTFFLLERTSVRAAGIAIMLGTLLFAAVQFAENRVSQSAARLPLKLSEIEAALGYGGLIHHFKNYVLRPNERHLATEARNDVTRVLNLIDAVIVDLSSGGIDADLQETRNAIHAYFERIDKVEAMHRQGASAREIDAVVRYDDALALRELALFRLQLASDVNSRLEFLRWSGMAIFIVTVAGIIAIQAIALRENRNSRNAFATAQGALMREREVNEELRAFSYAMSHDLKSPMNTVHLLLEEVRGGVDGDRLSEDQRELIGKSLATVDRVNVQIAELLRYAATIETGQEREEPVDLRDVVRGVTDDLAADMKAAQAVVEVGPLPVILCNLAQMRVLCQNLIINAFKYHRPEVPLVVRVGMDVNAASGDHRINFTDNGMGIPASQHERIFRLFTRLHRQDKIPGTGLGLSVCRRVARNLGGSLSVTSTPGKGSTFSLVVPADRVLTGSRRKSRRVSVTKPFVPMAHR